MLTMGYGRGWVGSNCDEWYRRLKSWLLRLFHFFLVLYKIRKAGAGEENSPGSSVSQNASAFINVPFQNTWKLNL